MSLENNLDQLELNSLLFEPDQVRLRIEALDWLEAYAETTSLRVEAIRTRFENLNSEVYQSIRSSIQQGASPGTLLSQLQNAAHDEDPAPGLSYDSLDELVSGVLQLPEPEDAVVSPTPEMVFYQPTPVRHILQLISLASCSEADTLTDLGSGLGHVPLLVSILTPAHCIGIEIEPAYIASAKQCAKNLRLNRATFMQQDAREADSTGTIFYLYTPFTGAMFAEVLAKLQHESTRRPIKVCTLGPCTLIVAREPWLRPCSVPDAGKITLFETCLR